VQATGEFRKPKKSEFFISGAIPEGYLASCDINCRYFIGRLVEVHKIGQELHLVLDMPKLTMKPRKFFSIQPVSF
jgi:hypothetical protein